MAAPYFGDTVDALIAASEGRLTTRIAELEGRMLTGFEALRAEFRTDIAGLRTDLKTEIAGLRGEWKVWMLVMGTGLAILGSGVGNRLLNFVWPAGPNGPAGTGVTTLR